jgi:hypothetical protein
MSDGPHHPLSYDSLPLILKNAPLSFGEWVAQDVMTSAAQPARSSSSTAASTHVGIL